MVSRKDKARNTVKRNNQDSGLLQVVGDLTEGRVMLYKFVFRSVLLYIENFFGIEVGLALL